MTPTRLLLALLRIAVLAGVLGGICYSVISLAGVDVQTLSTALGSVK